MAAASADPPPGLTNSGNDLRNGWYPDEGAISQAVSNDTFAQMWSANVNGQVYAQPLLSPSEVLVVATENDQAYGLDPASGKPLWSKPLPASPSNPAPATPWNPGDVGCADITPSIGTTATPVIDPSTNTVYLTHKTYASGTSGPAVWYMDALNIATGAEQSGFPKKLDGTADNQPSVQFQATTQQQRPGLLLMNGVVYAAFGSHCDAQPWEGWVFGVSTGTTQGGPTAGTITARWVSIAPADGSGAGIWQAGVGLTSDASGSILLSTGNGGALSGASPPVPGDQPPASLGEAVVRLQVQSDGSLKPVDFFEPFDAAQLDQNDQDFASGGVVGLPGFFGTAATPHLAVAVGKEGYVYLLNRDDLGGYDEGPDGSDAVVQRLGPTGGVWGRAGVWPGDGGYVYIPTSTGTSTGGWLDVYKYGLTGSGSPSLSLVASSSDSFGWGSGSPIITSDGTHSGSALVWVIWSSNRTGAGGQLRAYDPVPVNGQPHLVYSAPIGNATNYSDPGVGAGRLYVGTRDGKVIAFGSPVTPALTGSSLTFPASTDGTSSGPQTLTLTANSRVTISSLSSPSGQFTLGSPSPTLPATLTAGQPIAIQVTFAPTLTGPIGGQIIATTAAGDSFPFSVSGTGLATHGQLAAGIPFLSLGGTAVGQQLSGSATFTNIGGTTVKITGVHQPSLPFSAAGLPSVDGNTTIGPGDSITIEIDFKPTAVGKFADSIGLDATDVTDPTAVSSASIPLSATAGTPGHLQFSSESVDFGDTPLGGTSTGTFKLTNTGGTAVTITKSKPPFGGAFTALTSLQEGTTVNPGQTLNETVSFAPTAAGPATAGTWAINGDDDSGLHTIEFSGYGVPATGGTGSPPPATGAGGDGAPAAGGALASLPGAGVSSAQSASRGLVGEARIGAPRVAPKRVSAAQVHRLTVRYRAIRPGITRFVLQRRTEGRRGAHGCVRATARNHRARRCVRWVTVARFAHRDRSGTERLRIAAAIRPRTLSVGSYRLRSIVTYAAGRRHTYIATLRIVARVYRRRSA
ncbi:MAG: choice-of-anchor D domain-containing protein [Solirubrobacteraceae bacterium]